MDWTACIAAVTLLGVVAAVAWVGAIVAALALCRAAALGDRRLAEPAPEPEAVPESPRSAHELVAAALVALDVEHVTLFAGTRPERLRVVSRGHLDARADAEPPERHAEVAADAIRAGGAVELGGVAPDPVAAAMPVLRQGRPIGALALSGRQETRGRLTFAQRRALSELAARAADLPALHRGARVWR